MKTAYANLNEDGRITIHGMQVPMVMAKRLMPVEDAVVLSKQVGALVYWRPEHLGRHVDVAEVSGIIDGKEN